MPQEIVSGIIQEYPYKISNTEIVFPSFSAQSTASSGTTRFDVNFTATADNATATTTETYISPSLAPMLANTLRYDESAVYYVALDHINVNGNMLRFAEPVTANINYQDKMYFCRNEDLGIVSLSDKLEDCIKDFEDEVLFIWNEYGKEDDGKLTDDAKELKRRILSHL